MLKVESNLNEILIQIQKPLSLRPNIIENIAEIVRKDIETNLVQGTGLDGAGLPPKKDGGRLFFNTGELLKSVIKHTTLQGAEITIAESRYAIAQYLQGGTNKMPAREFFGISKRSFDEVNKLLESKDFNTLFEFK